jgi:ATP-dependent RNA helicase DOB1
MEGSIIRVLRRLEELLRQLASASLAIGNSELKNMFEEGSARIRRGVVFAASLYL